MKDKLELFANRVPDFAALPPARQLEYFAYFLTEILREDGVSGPRLRECFDALRVPPYSNIPAYLAKHSKKSKTNPPIFVRVKGNSYLNREFAAKLGSSLKGSHLVVGVKSDLRDLLPRIKNANQQGFLSEALACLEVKAYRASIIMVWLLAIDHLTEYILAKHLLAFNKVLAANTDKRVKVSVIANKDDFSDIPEGKLIEFCRSAKVISNDVRKILDAKLGIRNTSAHPSGVQISEAKAVDVIDDLVNNVILKYPI